MLPLRMSPAPHLRHLHLESPHPCSRLHREDSSGSLLWDFQILIEPWHIASCRCKLCCAWVLEHPRAVAFHNINFIHVPFTWRCRVLISRQLSQQTLREQVKTP